jgi:hypothetical protein
VPVDQSNVQAIIGAHQKFCVRGGDSRGMAREAFAIELGKWPLL